MKDFLSNKPKQQMGGSKSLPSFSLRKLCNEKTKIQKQWQLRKKILTQ